MSKCRILKNGIHVDVQGNIDYCCETTVDGVDRPTFTDYDSFKSHAMTVYEQSKTAWQPGCSGCQYREETDGAFSLRKEGNIITKHTDESDTSIWHAIINTANVCNLACRMCGQGPSSRWGHYIKHHSPAILAKQFTGSGASVHMHDDYTTAIVNEHVVNPNLRKLVLSGGEPTQSYRAMDLVQQLMDKGYSKNVKLQVITNASIPWKDTWADVLKYFGKINITISMDGTHDNYNYIRHEADFDTTVSIAEHLKDRCYEHGDADFGIAYCWQAANAHKFLYDQQWFEDRFPNFMYTTVHSPDYVTVDCIPTPLMEKYGIRELYGKEYRPEGFRKFMAAMRWMDRMFDKLGELENQNPDLFDYLDGREIYYEGKLWF